MLLAVMRERPDPLYASVLQAWEEMSLCTYTWTALHARLLGAHTPLQMLPKHKVCSL